MDKQKRLFDLLLIYLKEIAMSNVNSNVALRRLSAEGVSLGQVKSTIRRLQVEVAKGLNEEDRRLKAANPELEGTCWSLNVEAECEKRLAEADSLQGHYPGVRRETAEALGLRANAWWDEVYNLATA